MIRSAAVYGVTGNEHAVSGWSTVRLPFEPRGDLRAYRDELRAALRRMSPRHGEGLIATYGAPDHAFVDVENVTLYNIGSGAYSHLTGDGLVCQRTVSGDTRHRLTYRVGPLPDPDPEATQTLACVQSPLQESLHTPADWWTALHPRVRRNPEVVETHRGDFVVDITLTGSWSSPRIASMTKAMLDGLISTLHCHDGTNADNLLARLAPLGSPPDVWRALCEPCNAVLGQRSLVHTHGTRIAWNPADHLCAAFRIRIEPGPTRGLYAVIRSLPNPYTN